MKRAEMIWAAPLSFPQAVIPQAQRNFDPNSAADAAARVDTAADADADTEAAQDARAGAAADLDVFCCR